MPKLVAAGAEVGQGSPRATAAPACIISVDAIRNLAKNMSRLRISGRAIYVSGIGSKYPTQTMLLADSSGVVEVKTGLRGQVGRKGCLCGCVWIAVRRRWTCYCLNKGEAPRKAYQYELCELYQRMEDLACTHATCYMKNFQRYTVRACHGNMRV